MPTPPTATQVGHYAGGERLLPVRALSGPRSVLRYARHPLRRFEAARAVSDRAVAFRVFGVYYILLFDPAMIEQVLVTRHAEFHKDRFTGDLRRVLGTGLLTSEGDVWRRHRKLMAPPFQRAEIAAYQSVMTSCAESFIAGQARGVPFDVHAALMHLTLDVLVQALFGARIARAEEVGELLDRLMPDYLPIAEALRTTLPEWFPVPSRARLQRIRGQLDVILLELISERKAALEAPSAAAMAPQDDLLTRLMRSRDDAGGMTDAALRDEAMTLFLAGHETTALALTYALWLLSLHPAEEQSLRRELGHVLGGRTPTTEDLPALPYARAVVDEALRLYPPAWAFGREPFAALDLLGVHVPLGTQVLVSPWVMHRDPRFFEQPDRFWPERWFGPPPPRFTYLPFGAGPRVCIGQHFAIAEAVLLLATLVQRAHFSREPASPLRLMAAVTLRPKDPVMMRAEAPPTI